jgi:L-threonylcarbamoyladenylate synthase
VPIVPPTPEHLAAAARALETGGLVIVPTETVYGLAANATDPHAVAKIFAAKGRPQFNPLIAHVPGKDEAAEHAALNADALMLIDAFWPGPLTIVAPRREASPVCDLACAGLATIALRAPAHPAMRALLGLIEFPLAAPSANRSGHLSATTAAHAAEDVGAAAALTLDGGPTTHGLESTIIALVDRPRLLRPGAIPADAIEALIGPLARTHEGDPVSAPGMLARHYAPRAKLRLNATAPEAGERYLGFGPAPAGAATLSVTGDLTEAAANLFAMLRALDAEGAPAIAVAPIPETGLGEAINDRLRRAAEGR